MTPSRQMVKRSLLGDGYLGELVTIKFDLNTRVQVLQVPGESGEGG